MTAHSLRWRMTGLTLLVLLISAVLAGSVAFVSAYEETGELIDEQLRSVAITLADMNAPIGRYASDDDDGIWVDIVKDSDELALIPTEFSLLTQDGNEFQAYHLPDDDKHIIVRQRNDSQDELAFLSAMYSLVPLLAVSLVLMMALPLLVWHSFRSVQVATGQLGKRQSHDLSPLAVDNFPKEILPFAHAINALLAKAQSDLDAQKRFIADASHELRSPLTAISLQVQHLQNQTDLTKIQTGLTKLAKNVAQNQDLVEKLLTIARLDSNTWHNQPTDLAQIIKNTLTLLLPIINSKALDIDVHIRPYMVNIDETALLLLIKNLIQNAVIYTPNQGKLSIHLSDDKHQLQSFGTLLIGQGNHNTKNHYLQIKDSGIGIHQHDYEKVFKAFVRLSHSAHSDSSTHKGTGLGLSMVYSICQKAGIELYFNQSQFKDKVGGLCVTLVF